jgi:hypothetical protein
LQPHYYCLPHNSSVEEFADIHGYMNYCVNNRTLITRLLRSSHCCENTTRSMYEYFMKTGRSLPWSQQPITTPYPGSAESSTHSNVSKIRRNFHLCLHLVNGLPLQFFSEYCQHSLILKCVLRVLSISSYLI